MPIPPPPPSPQRTSNSLRWRRPPAHLQISVSGTQQLRRCVHPTAFRHHNFAPEVDTVEPLLRVEVSSPSPEPVR